jgi:tetratricopeptide (TPR) repeat protein
MGKPYRITFLLIFIVNVLFAKNIDSLLVSLSRTDSDTSKIKAFIDLAEQYQKKGDVVNAKLYCKNAIDLSTRINNSYYLACAYRTMGGAINNGEGDFTSALDNLLKAYKWAEDADNTTLLFDILNKLGNTYFGQKKYDIALEYYNKAEEKAIELNDNSCLSVVAIGKGNIYSINKKYKESIESFELAIEGFKNTNIKGWAVAMLSLSEIYIEKNEVDKAFTLLQEINKVPFIFESSYIHGHVFLITASAYNKIGDYPSAIDNYYKSIKVFTESSSIYDLKNVYQNVAETFYKSNKFDSAYHYVQLYSDIADSIYSVDNLKLINEMQAKYESEKKDKENKLLLFENELSADKIKEQQRLQIGLFLFLGMTFIFSFFLFRSNKQKNRKNEIILKQKEEVEYQRSLLQVKNKEVLDSIAYAKYLQDAILPSMKAIKKYFPNSFVLYKPKDIVAGDFYWLESINRNIKKDVSSSVDITSSLNSNSFLIAAADCTGHGVPGAMVSVVCSNAMNRAVKEFGITQPGLILDKVQELVIKTFVKEDSDSVVKDGMDISLLRIDCDNDMFDVQWAGAYNPLWIIRKGELGSYKLEEIKANKQTVGKVDTPYPFTTHSFTLNKGDLVYLFTDGYADQFGEISTKKFKYKKLKELLLSSAHLSMDEQKELLDTTFDDWKGNLEQIDDVLLMGIQL